MKHFLAALETDARLLYRTGYAAATLVVFLLLLILAAQISRIDFAGFADIVTAMVLVDQVVSCLMLVGLMILLERGEGIVTALAVTPMPRSAYIAAKTVAVSVICAIQMILLVLLVYDGALSVGLLFAGLFGMAAILTLLGIVIVAPFDTLFRFLLPMLGASFVLALPGYGVLFDWRPAWLDAHPMSPPLTVLEAAFAEVSAGRLAYGLLGTLIWAIIAAVAAYFALGVLRLRAAGG